MPRPNEPAVSEAFPTEVTDADAAPSTLPGRSRRNQDKRLRILDAAIKVFARGGYHGARVSDIAREAGIAYGLVYHYFKNKDEILATIFEERWGDFIAMVRRIGLNGRPLSEQLVAIAALVLNGYRIRPDWVRVLVFEIQRSSRFAQPAQMAAIRQLYDEVGELFQRGVASGELRRDLDERVAATMFIGALEHKITSLALGVVELPTGDAAQQAYYLEFAETIVDHFLNGCGTDDRTERRSPS